MHNWKIRWKLPTLKILTFIIVRLSETWRRHVAAHPRAALGTACALLVMLGFWFVIDTSDELTPEQILILRQFVVRTQSATVQERFNEAVEDHDLTINETRTVIEAAKREGPPYGLVSDQGASE